MSLKPRSNLWPRVQELLHRIEKPVRYIDGELNVVKRPEAPYSFGLSYPGTYEVGMANQALQLLYSSLIHKTNFSIERVFIPWTDLISEMEKENLELFTLESVMAVRDLDLLGITIPHELSYTTILEILKLSKIPFMSKDRLGESGVDTALSKLMFPLLIGGGPCVFNPEPIAELFDAFFIGEGEEVIQEIAACYENSLEKDLSYQEFLEQLAQIDGMYIPSFYEASYNDDGTLASTSPINNHAKQRIYKRVIKDLSKVAPLKNPIVPYMDVIHDRFAFEILRGCTRGCRFCQAGMTYRPVRERSADEIVSTALCGLANTGYEEVSLTSLSSADHSQLEEILRRLNKRLQDKGISVSLPSLRVDAFSIEMARLMAGSGRKSGLTFAPEAGSQRMRDVINKNVSEEELLATVGSAFESGWLRLKLYFMIGLPFETDEDIRAIGDLSRKVYELALEKVGKSKRGSVSVSVSVSSFVPKAHTPFQWFAQNTQEEIARKQQILRESMPRKGVRLSYHDSAISSLEGVLSRGDRRLLPSIIEAHALGSRFDAWSEEFKQERWDEAFKATGFNPAWVANRERSVDEVLPWDHISTGVTKSYLLRELKNAQEAATTVDCSFDECTNCGVCPRLDVDVLLGSGEESRV